MCGIRGADGSSVGWLVFGNTLIWNIVIGLPFGDSRAGRRTSTTITATVFFHTTLGRHRRRRRVLRPPAMMARTAAKQYHRPRTWLENRNRLSRKVNRPLPRLRKNRLTKGTDR